MAGLIALLATSALGAALTGELEEESPTLCDSSVTQYSGYFHLRTSKLLHGKNYFYWRAPAPRRPRRELCLRAAPIAAHASPMPIVLTARFTPAQPPRACPRPVPRRRPALSGVDARPRRSAPAPASPYP
jgi:hypothetical protein